MLPFHDDFFFFSECTLDSAANDSSECGDGEMAGDIPNGMLCYTGLTPGSTAAYSCDKDYELNEGNGTLVCQDDRMWSGTPPSCVKSEYSDACTSTVP